MSIVDIELQDAWHYEIQPRTRRQNISETSGRYDPDFPVSSALGFKTEVLKAAEEVFANSELEEARRARLLKVGRGVRASIEATPSISSEAGFARIERLEEEFQKERQTAGQKPSRHVDASSFAKNRTAENTRVKS